MKRALGTVSLCVLTACTGSPSAQGNGGEAGACCAPDPAGGSSAGGAGGSNLEPEAGPPGCGDGTAEGQAACGSLRTDPAQLSFGNVFVGQTRLLPVLVTNTGSGPVTLTGIAPSEPALGYALAPTAPAPPALPVTLEPGATTWIGVSYRPGASGPLSAAITLVSSEGTLALPALGNAEPLVDYADVTSHGAVGDGIHDDTDAFRAAAATGKLLYVPMPPGGDHYKLTGRIDLSGPGVIGAPGPSKPWIRMYEATGYGGIPAPHVMFELDHYAASRPAIFTGLHLDGGWDGDAFVGEWDHLIQLRNSKNVTIENNLMENPMGDCILLGGEGDFVPPSENVTISNNVCRNPWRCTVALISARDVAIVANRLEKPNGHIVEGGSFYHFNLDFEPNPNAFDAVWGALVAFNHVTSHVSHTPYPFDNGIAIGLSHSIDDVPPDGFAGGDIRIHDNTGTAPGAFFQPKMNTGPETLWTNVSAFRNANPTGCYPPWGDCP